MYDKLGNCVRPEAAIDTRALAAKASSSAKVAQTAFCPLYWISGKVCVGTAGARARADEARVAAACQGA